MKSWGSCVVLYQVNIGIFILIKSRNLFSMLCAGGFSFSTSCLLGWACTVMAWAIYVKAVRTSASTNPSGLTSMATSAAGAWGGTWLSQAAISPFHRTTFLLVFIIWKIRIDVRYSHNAKYSHIREGTIRSKEGNFPTHHPFSNSW